MRNLDNYIKNKAETEISLNITKIIIQNIVKWAYYFTTKYIFDCSNSLHQSAPNKRQEHQTTPNLGGKKLNSVAASVERLEFLRWNRTPVGVSQREPFCVLRKTRSSFVTRDKWNHVLSNNFHKALMIHLNI